MGMAYACADLVVCRAGANTVFEILALKKPTLFVPLQNASRGDQLQNADYFFKKGLCHLLGEDHLSALPLAVALLENDKELPLRLKASLFPAGNDLILQKIRKYLS